MAIEFLSYGFPENANWRLCVCVFGECVCVCLVEIPGHKGGVFVH